MLTHSQPTDDLYTSGFHINDEFLDTTTYLALCTLIKQHHGSGALKPARIGQNVSVTEQPMIRNDHTIWLDPKDQQEAIQRYFSAIEELKITLNRTLFLGLMTCEAHFAVYPPNGFYKKHVDQFRSTKDRRISCVYYLNDHWHPDFGGDLQLYDKMDQHLASITPKGNRLVCFHSDMPHEVSTSHDLRYSIAAWLKTRPSTPVTARRVVLNPGERSDLSAG